MENTGNTNNKSKAKKWLLGGLGVVALGTLTFFGIDYYTRNKRKEKKAEPAKPKVKAPPKKQAATKPKKTVPPKPNASIKTSPIKAPIKQEAPKPAAQKPEATFPLKKGDRGKLVKELKEMLILRFGKEMLSNELFTDVYGEQLEVALKNLKVPVIKGRVILTEAKYKELMRPDPTNSKQNAALYRQYLNDKNFKSFIALLKEVRNVNEYKLISSYYMKYPPNKSLLSAAFVVFKDQKQQQELRSQFLRIGLKYDGQKWTLAGIKNTPKIITITATTVWKDSKTSVPVPVNMVLGIEIAKRGDYTLFENDKQYFLVESKTIKPYNV